MLSLVPYTEGTKKKSRKVREDVYSTIINHEEEEEEEEYRVKHTVKLCPVYQEYYDTTTMEILGPEYIYEQDKISYQKTTLRSKNLVIWNTVYNRNAWKEEGIPYIKGQHNDLLEDWIWLELARQVPNPFHWHQVYKIFRKEKLEEWWTGFGAKIGFPVKITGQANALTTKYIDLTNSKYRVPFCYLLYKFLQMEKLADQPEKYIPLHRSKSWCRKTDIWWKTVCEEKGFPFIPTIVYKLDWPKQSLLSMIAKSVKNHNLLNREP